MNALFRHAFLDEDKVPTSLLEQRAQFEFERLKETMEELFREHNVRGMIETDLLGWPKGFRIERVPTSPYVDEIRAGRSPE